tara:strand:+ start:697 stop:942 length:246 start_codon:yes stop_codon:yes gene_type:complete
MNLSRLFLKRRSKDEKHRELLEEQKLMKKIIEEQQVLIGELEEVNKTLANSLRQQECPEQVTKYLCERIDMLKFKNMQETK